MKLLLPLAFTALAWAQTLPLEPTHESGANITGAFEGWYKNPDGSFNLLLGYFNRNTRLPLRLLVESPVCAKRVALISGVIRYETTWEMLPVMFR